MTTDHYDEDDDLAERFMLEHAAENQAKYGGRHAERGGESEAPSAPAPRVRIPAPVPTAAPAPSPAAEQEDFDAQLAALQDEHEEVPTVASVKRTEEPNVETEGVRLFPKASGGERRKGQHRPGLKRAPRFRLTDEDSWVIEFLAAARYGTASTVSFFLGKERRTVERRLSKLTERGYLFKRSGSSAGALFSPTEFGLEEVDIPARMEQEDFSLRAVSHTLAAANVLALLLSGTARPSWAKLLTLPDFPVHEHFLTEKELRRQVNLRQASINTRRDSKAPPWRWDTGELYHERDKRLTKWAAGQEAHGAKQEVEQPWTFLILRHQDLGEYGYHLPDLMLTYPRFSTTHEARAVAVEVELHAVNEDKLHNAMRAYAEEFGKGAASSYGSVVWLCRNEKVAKAVAAAVTAVMPRDLWARVKVQVLDSRALTGVSFAGRQANFTPDQKARRDANLVTERFTRGLYKTERTALAAAKTSRGGE
ncbi:hypothetical protein SAMN05443575_1464 [Jatrophihabitans endophyticus]|uniref:Replication-relaxation n=1 Tax=Jatrophihabitans endophyticus TaxID=1206085 RepID=A0A1M5HBQ1_9ACTN|nr:hypothetical protein [Jatrophihabitans endophyticus]SHG13367.1 hypothetical protein SAMN05443575_1464 [Jatrophihabitans endophyticus]